MSPAIPSFPTLQFRPYGLTEPELPTRFLSSIDADMDSVYGVWLGHADGDRYAGVGTLDRPHFDDAHRPWADVPGMDAEVAYRGTLILVQLMSPPFRTQPDNYGQQLVDVADTLAAERSLWQPSEWTINGLPHEAQLTRFADGWTGHTSTGGLYVVVVGVGIPEHIVLDVVPDGQAHGVDFDRPLHGVDSQLRSPPVDFDATSPEQVHADFERLLRTRDIR